jgi:hypothetical protein
MSTGMARCHGRRVSIHLAWDIVLRPKWKSVVTSKWIYKIKHAVDGSVENVDF